MQRYSFAERLSASREAANVDREIEAIRGFFADADRVQVVDANGNDGGTDYIVHIRNGRPIRIDAKRRLRGCSKFWQGEEELALELWSVVERKKKGWTLDPSKQTEYNLITYHPDDSCRQFLLAFQLLRRAFNQHGPVWVKRYRRATQQTTDGGGWKSECVFVPVSVVRSAMHGCEIRMPSALEQAS